MHFLISLPDVTLFSSVFSHWSCIPLCPRRQTGGLTILPLLLHCSALSTSLVCDMWIPTERQYSKAIRQYNEVFVESGNTNPELKTC